MGDSTDCNELFPPPPPPIISGLKPSVAPGHVPPPPAPNATGHQPPSTNRVVPPPRQKLRRLAWSKIPASRVVGRTNVWTTSDQLFGGTRLDFNRLEELFAVNVVPAGSVSSSGSSSSTAVVAPTSPSGLCGVKYPVVSATGLDGIRPSSAPRGRRQSEEINLLDSRRSLNVNVFLRQFRLQSYEDLVQILANGESELLGAEKLRCLLRLLPAEDERNALMAFQGDRSRLGNAEKFCSALLELPHYEIRVETMLFKEEFLQSFDRLRSATSAVIRTAMDLKTNKALHEVLYMVLLAGNFLNTGGCSGDAAGFRLTSLLSLAELRSNKPRMTLLHYVALEVEEKNAELLNFPDQLEFLKQSAEYAVDSLKSDIACLVDQHRTVSNGIKSVETTFSNKFTAFLEDSRLKLKILEMNLKQVESLRVELATYYCEDESTFQLDDAFKVLSSFCDKFMRAIKENRDRRVQDQKSEERRKQLEEKLKLLDECSRRRGSLAPSGELNNNDTDNDLVGALFGVQSSRHGRTSRSRSVCDTTGSGRQRYQDVMVYFQRTPLEGRNSLATDACRQNAELAKSRRLEALSPTDDQRPARPEVQNQNGDQATAAKTGDSPPVTGRVSGLRRLRVTSSFDDGCRGRERVSGWNAERQPGSDVSRTTDAAGNGTASVDMETPAVSTPAVSTNDSGVTVEREQQPARQHDQVEKQTKLSGLKAPTEQNKTPWRTQSARVDRSGQTATTLASSSVVAIRNVTGGRRRSVDTDDSRDPSDAGSVGSFGKNSADRQLGRPGFAAPARSRCVTTRQSPAARTSQTTPIAATSRRTSAADSARQVADSRVRPTQHRCKPETVTSQFVNVRIQQTRVASCSPQLPRSTSIAVKQLSSRQRDLATRLSQPKSTTSTFRRSSATDTRDTDEHTAIPVSHGRSGLVQPSTRQTTTRSRTGQQFKVAAQTHNCPGGTATSAPGAEEGKTEETMVTSSSCPNGLALMQLSCKTRNEVICNNDQLDTELLPISTTNKLKTETVDSNSMATTLVDCTIARHRPTKLSTVESNKDGLHQPSATHKDNIRPSMLARRGPISQCKRTS